MNSLPSIPGNPSHLMERFKNRGGHPLAFALYGGYNGGRHAVILPVVTNDGKGENFHFTNFDLGELDGLIKARIISTAQLVAGIQEHAN